MWGCVVEAKKVRLTLHHISSVAQPTSQANLQRELPRRHQMSQNNEELVYNGHPVELQGPPVDIYYYESLAKLRHDLSGLSNSLEPSADYIAQTVNPR